MSFTWTSKEDDNIYKNGVTVCIAAGSTESIQHFVEELSNKIGHKCDWAFTGGRAHIDVLPEGKDAALKYVNDPLFMKQFVVPYSEEADDNKTYLEFAHITNEGGDIVICHVM